MLAHDILVDFRSAQGPPAGVSSFSQAAIVFDLGGFGVATAVHSKDSGRNIAAVELGCSEGSAVVDLAEFEVVAGAGLGHCEGVLAARQEDYEVGRLPENIETLRH